MGSCDRSAIRSDPASADLQIASQFATGSALNCKRGGAVPRTASKDSNHRPDPLVQPSTGFYVAPSYPLRELLAAGIFLRNHTIW